MKKLLTFMMLAAMLLTACVKEEKFADEMGDKVTVTFTVDASTLQTKANSDFAKGTNADQLLVQAFVLEGESYVKTDADKPENLTITKTADLKWTVDIKLAKNQTYKIAFWAQKSETGIYNTADLSAVTVDYTKMAINSDDADAFCAARMVHVNGALSEKVELFRPLSQINLGTSDRNAYINSVVTDAKKTLWAEYTLAAGVPSTLNVIGGAMTADSGNIVPAAVTAYTTADVTYPAVKLLNVDDKLLEGYEYIAMGYVLADPEKSTMDFTATIYSGAEAADVLINTVAVSNMPFQANFRTNVYGQLLTSTLNYNVEIIPGFETPDFEIEVVEEVAESVSDLNAQLVENKEAGVQDYNVNELDKDAEEAATSTIVIPDNTTSTTISFNVAEVAEGVNEIIIKDANPAVEETNFQNTVIIEVPASVNLDAVTVTVNAPNAHVILKKGDYSTVVASTSGTTLVVEAGATVDLLKVKAGNIKIEAGATVTSIVRETGNADARTLVIMEQGATWTNMAAEKSDKLVVVTTREGFSFDGAAYHVENKTGLANFRDMVNGGEMPADMTVVLDTDLDMTGVEWTPIGVESYTNNFRGVFDGKGHTISNLSVTHVKTAGLFGTLCGNATIKNLNMKDVALRSNHYAGGIVAWAEQGGSPILVDNCSVSGGTIVSEPEKISGAYDNGDKVGGIVGFAHAGQYTNNSVADVTLTAYRDLAGVAGYATKATITGNSVSNVIVNQSNKNAYKDGAITTKGEIVGRDGGENTVSGNTASNVTLLVDGCTKTTLTDGTVQLAPSAQVEGSLAAALEAAATEIAAEKKVVVSLGAGEYTMPSTVPAGVTIDGGNQDDVIINIGSQTIRGNGISIKNVTIKRNSSAGSSALSVTGSVSLENIILQSSNRSYGINLTGGDDNTVISIKNVKFEFTPTRGIMLESKGNITIEDCDLIAGYCISTLNDTNYGNVTLNRCTLVGWTSYNVGVGHTVTFNDCEFKQGNIWQTYGYPPLYDRLFKPYVTTALNNCVFCTPFYLDLSGLQADQTITFKNCESVDGVALTAESIYTLFEGSDEKNTEQTYTTSIFEIVQFE